MPARPRRLHRTMKWVGLFALAIILAAWGLSGWRTGEVWVGGSFDGFGADVMHGSVTLRYGDMDPGMPWSAHAQSTRYGDDVPWDWLPHWHFHRGVFSAKRVTMVAFAIPLWIPLILVAVPTVRAFLHDRRKPANSCPHCSYPRSGLPPNSLCPECGEKSAA